MLTILLALIAAPTLGSNYSFNLSETIYPQDRLEYQILDPYSIQVYYDPITFNYLNRTFTLNPNDIQVLKDNITYTYFNGTANVTRTVIGQSVPQPAGQIQYIRLPFKSDDYWWTLDFLVPVVDTPNADVFDVKSLLEQANMTQNGMVAYANEDNNRRTYITPNIVYTSIPALLAKPGVTSAFMPGDFNQTSLVPKRTNVLSYGIDPSTYFINEMSWNWAFWVFWGVLLGYCIHNIYVDYDMVFESRYRDNWLTNYGPYSLYHTATEHFTKQSRMLVIIVAISAFVFFNGLLTKTHPWIHLALKLALIPFCAVVFAMPFEFIVGMLLNRAYQTNIVFLQKTKIAENYAEKMIAQEEWERDQFRAYFLTYFVGGFFAFTFGVLCIYFMWGLPIDRQGWFFLAIFISAVWYFFLFEGLISLFSKWMPCGNRLAQMRGFYFNYPVQEELVQFHLE